MIIKMFNFWYFFFIAIGIAMCVGLYFLLRNRSERTQKIVLFSILAFALALHFLKLLFPPFSNDPAKAYRDSWFVNICGANIALFPFLFLSKSNSAKDYMFYLGLLGGLTAVLYPIEPIQMPNQTEQTLNIIRFYIHHIILWVVPLLMVLLKLHKLDYKRVIFCPIWLMGVMLFIMINQILQSELGFIGMRGDDISKIPYSNPSKIWGPGNDTIGKILSTLCPSFFKKIPVGAHAGEPKYWPWFWLIVPVFVILTPLCFLISLLFDSKHFASDCKTFFNKVFRKNT